MKTDNTHLIKIACKSDMKTHHDDYNESSTVFFSKFYFYILFSLILTIISRNIAIIALRYSTIVAPPSLSNVPDDFH